MASSTSETLYESAFNNLQQMLDLLEASMDSMPKGLLSPTQIQTLLQGLPRVEEEQLLRLGEKDSSCPICLTPYTTILTEEEMALAMDSPAHPVEELGVTKLSQPWQCGHIFCRRDISQWITEGHDSCPMCRRFLVEAQGSNDVDNTEDRDDHNLAEELEAALSRLRQLREENGIPGPNDIVNGLFISPSASRTEDEYDDRAQYSGMYS